MEACKQENESRLGTSLKGRILTVIRGSCQERIESGFPLEVPIDICAALEMYIKEIRDSVSVRKSEFNIEEFKEILPDCFPPCMVHALSGAQSGSTYRIPCDLP